MTVTKSKPHLPWIIQKQFKSLSQKKVKKEITKSYHTYINVIIDESLALAYPKRFWFVIKETENFGIPTFK